MAVTKADEELADRLGPLGGVTRLRMFGGLGIYQRGRIFALIFKGRVYFKVDGESEGDYRARGVGPFRPSERQTLRSYYEVPPDVLGDTETFLSWAAEAVRASWRAR